MTKCGDCLHYPVCKNYVDENESFPEVGGCDAFKNKADFVEVVRCKDYIHKFDIEGRCMCNINAEEAFDKWFGLRATYSENFCGYGERKDT